MRCYKPILGYSKGPNKPWSLSEVARDPFVTSSALWAHEKPRRNTDSKCIQNTSYLKHTQVPCAWITESENLCFASQEMVEHLIIQTIACQQVQEPAVRTTVNLAVKVGGVAPAQVKSQYFCVSLNLCLHRVLFWSGMLMPAEWIAI